MTDSIVDLLTNPETHNPDEFIYLVKAVVSDYDKYREAILSVRDPHSFYSASLIGRVNASTLMSGAADREISCLGTYGGRGLIIKPVSDEAIHIAWNCDLGSPNTQEELKRFAEMDKGLKIPPYSLLAEATGYPVKYNHLIVRGDQNTQICGVFYKGDGKNRENAEELSAHIVNAIGYSVPLIHVPQETHILEEGTARLAEALGGELNHKHVYNEFHERSNYRKEEWKRVARGI